MAGTAPTTRSVNIYIDATSAERALGSLQKQQQKLTEAIEQGKKVTGGMTAEIEKLSQVGKKIAALEDQQAKLTATIEKGQAAGKDMTAAMERLAKVKDKISLLGKEQAHLTETIHKSEKAQKDLAAQIEKTSKKVSDLNEEQKVLAETIREGEAAGMAMVEEIAKLETVTAGIASAEQKQAKLTEAFQRGEASSKDMTAEIAKLAEVEGKISTLQDQIEGKLAPSFKQVQQQAAAMRRELEGMSEDAPGYAEKFAAFEEVSKLLNGMKAKIDEARNSLDEEPKGFFGWLGDMKDQIASVAIGTLISEGTSALADWALNAIPAAISAQAELSDSLSDVEKATGLSADEVSQLNKELRGISTRTATEELRNIAIGLGQIGEAATAEAVASIDKIVVALGDEFGGGSQEITTKLGVLRNNLQDIKTGDYGDDVLKIGNALNVLGAEGLATAPVITDTAERLAGVGGTFGLTSGQILGTAAAFQELGIESERGSTALNKILLKITTETKTFAKVAGVPVQEFAQLVNKDVLAAFQLVAKGAKESGQSNIEFGKILKQLEADGSGAGEVLSKLAGNSDLLNKKIKLAGTALKGTSSITEEFEKKNNNLAGTLEKIGKKLSGAFSPTFLTPLLTGAVNLFAELIGVVDHTDEKLKEFQAQAEKVRTLEDNLNPVIQKYEELQAKATALGGASKLSTLEQNNLKTAIQDIAKEVPTAITEFDKYGRAIEISAGKAREFVRLQRLILKEKNRDAIAEQNATLRELEKQRDLYQKSLNTRNAKGDLVKNEVKTSGRDQQNAKVVETLLSPDEVVKLQVGLGQVQDRITGIKGLVGELSGAPPPAKWISTVVEDIDLSNPEEMAKAEAARQSAQSKADAAAAKAKARLERKLRDMEDFSQKVATLEAERIAAQAGNDELEQQKVREKYQKLGIEAEKFYREYGQNLIEVGQLAGLQEAELQRLFAEQYTKRAEAEYEGQLKQTKDYYSRQAQAAGEAFANGTTNAAEFAASTRSIAKDQAVVLATIAQDYSATSTKAAEDVEGAKTAATAAGIDERINLEDKAERENEAKAQRALLSARPGSNAALAAQKELLEAKFQQEIRYLAKTDEAYKLAEANRNKATAEAERQNLKAKQDQIIGYVQGAAQILDTLFAFQDRAQQEDLQKFTSEQDKKRKALDKRLEKGQISEEAYRKQVDKLDEETRKKELEFKKAKFERDKISAVLQAGINTALAVTAALASGPSPYNLILAGIAGAAGAAQIAFIASQKAPEYAKGGLLDGPRHSEGGIAMVDSKTGKKVGEVEGGEPVLSRETYANNKAMIDRLLYSSMYQGGRTISAPAPLAAGALTNTFTRNALMRNGGFVGGTSIARSTDFGSTEGGGALMEMLLKLNDKLDKPFTSTVLWNEIDAKNKENARLRAAGSLKGK